MSEPFDLELFLEGKRVWDEGEAFDCTTQAPTLPESGAVLPYGPGRSWRRKLTGADRNAVRYFTGLGSPYGGPFDMRNELAAEILRLRRELEELGRR